MRNLTAKQFEKLQGVGILKKDGTLTYRARVLYQLKIGFIVRPISYTGSGRYISVRDESHYVEQVAAILGYKYKKGNDAPRGGKAGTFYKFTSKGRSAILAALGLAQNPEV